MDWGGNTPNLLLSQNQPVICPLKAGLFHVKYKCNICHLFFSSGEHIVDGKCPECGSLVVKACENDHICTCSQDIQEGIHYCSCGAMICKCGSHNVDGISRVTGYLNAVSGFNNGKRAELIDRTRYNLLGAVVSNTSYQ